MRRRPAGPCTEKSRNFFTRLLQKKKGTRPPGDRFLLDVSLIYLMKSLPVKKGRLKTKENGRSEKFRLVVIVSGLAVFGVLALVVLLIVLAVLPLILVLLLLELIVLLPILALILIVLLILRHRNHPSLQYCGRLPARK